MSCPFMPFSTQQSTSRLDFAAYKAKATAIAATLPATLDEKTVEIIKATEPAVAGNMEAITQKFYPYMFEKYSWSKNYFNLANHVVQPDCGKKPQPFALAHALCRYLKHIDDKAALTKSIELAAQKHCALVIQAEHYPIVYECFFHAVGEVLGEAVTPEIRAAWGTYVLFIARVFIERELEIYEESSSRDYGWFGFKEFVLVGKRRETDSVYTYVFEPKDGRRLPSFKAGQYITLKVNGIGHEGETEMRHYSVSSPPGQNVFQISVQLEQGPNGAPPGVVSAYLREKMQLGDKIEVGMPFGTIALPSTTDGRPICLLAGGIGCTVTASVFDHLLKDKEFSRVFYLHQVRNSSHHAYKDQAIHAQFKNDDHVKVLRYYSAPRPCDLQGVDYDQEGHVSIEALQKWMGDDFAQANYIMCGPEAMVHSLLRGLLKSGVPVAQIQFECFGPLGLMLEEFVV